MIKRRSLAATLLVLCGCSLLRAQTFDLTAKSPPLADLSHAQWRFHPGDDPRWADPGFDDSQWPLLAGDRSWDAQGYKRYSGIAWYRIRIKLPPQQPVSISPGHLYDSYEVFADGQKIMHWGSLKPDAIPLATHYESQGIAEVPHPSGEVLLALRVWHAPIWAVYYGGGFTGTPVLFGSPAGVKDGVALQQRNRWLESSPRIFTALVSIFAGLFGLLLFAKERSSREYLWFGILETSLGLRFFWYWIAVRDWLAVSVAMRDFIAVPLDEFALVASILFIFRFVDRPLSRWARGLLIAQIPVALLACYVFLFSVFQGAIGIATVGLFGIVNKLLVDATSIWVVARYWRESRAARRIALPLVLLTAVDLVAGIYGILITAGLTAQPALMSSINEFRYGYAVQLIFLGAMAYILTERFAETQAERTRLHGEFEAARTVQQVLIPDFLPPVAGLIVASAYLPAQEVGGDFFQVLPIPNAGDAFIVVGDVSGKGLPAAMTVSLIVGTLRTLAEYVASPAELLAGLNRRLHGRDAGFATCLVLKITPQGDVTLANAGHPNPYLDGVEISTESNLPLGITLEVTYAETRLHIDPAQSFALVTDGVVEATAPATRELFGFARTQAISRQAANAIAEAAKAFGFGAPQSDDITVLTVTRTAILDAAPI